MAAFGVLWTLAPQTILLFLFQMLIITTVVRGAIACNYWFLWRSWQPTVGLVILAHVIALFGFAAMTDFVDAGSESSDGVAMWLHSAAILWPLQLPLLVVDLMIRARRARLDASF